MQPSLTRAPESDLAGDAARCVRAFVGENFA
jgi:hypothetical protein